MILVNIKDIKVQFSQNVLYHVKDDFFVYKKKQITKKDISWVFTERVTYFCLNTAQYVQIVEYSECFIMDARFC